MQRQKINKPIGPGRKAKKALPEIRKGLNLENEINHYGATAVILRVSLPNGVVSS